MTTTTPPDNMPGSYERHKLPAPGKQVVMMPGVTLWQPWAASVIYGPKNYENRTWRPPAAIVGTRIFIQASKRQPELPDWEEWEEVAELARSWGQDVPPFRQRSLDFGAIIGTALVTGVLDLRRATSMPDPWVSGPFAWALADKRPCVPIPCKGAQGIWYFDEEQVRAADRQWRRDNSPRVAAN